MITPAGKGHFGQLALGNQWSSRSLSTMVFGCLYYRLYQPLQITAAVTALATLRSPAASGVLAGHEVLIATPSFTGDWQSQGTGGP